MGTWLYDDVGIITTAPTGTETADIEQHVMRLGVPPCNTPSPTPTPKTVCTFTAAHAASFFERVTGFFGGPR